MKRSEINSYIKEAEALFKEYCIKLPPWGYWSPEDWQGKGSEYNEIRNNGLGWDITDFGSGDFEKIGLFLFTIRNGNFNDPENKKTYAEKIMVAREKQVTPMHFHWKKMEDIINRGGAELVMKLWKADDQEGLSEDDFTVQVDGVTKILKSGGELRLQPGESVCLEPYVYHTFWAENGTCLIGEVSMVNDDANDNRFYQPAGRFPKVEEDEPAYRYLCNEYPV
jgi:D-lyxose ketol-isomerase